MDRTPMHDQSMTPSPNTLPATTTSAHSSQSTSKSMVYICGECHKDNELKSTDVIRSVSSMTISPHGGYVSIDEGADFYVECIGPSPKWIIAKRLISDTARISTQSVQINRKSILTIQGMSSSLVGPYLCQTNQSVSTIILQLTKRKLDMTKQIRFMGTNTNHTVPYGNDIRLNCFAQYYSEKAMDSPYIPKILWFFERRQLHHNEHKYIFGVDSLFIRNFTYHDQGVYFCRAFITLKTRFLMKLYPILVQLQNSSQFVNEALPPSLENKNCDNLNETAITNNAISYCNTDGYVTNCTCPQGQIWNKDYSQCSSPMNQNQILQIIPNVSHMNVELGRTYTFACRSTDDGIEPEWTYENGTIIGSSTHTEQPITTYTLSESRTLYLRLSPSVSGTYICRSRPEENSILKEEPSITTTSITLREQMIVQTNGISFQSSALAEYHVRTNSTLFVACRPEYFNFQLKTNLSYVPAATLIRVHDNHHFLLTTLIDGLLIDRISKSESGMYLCMGMIPLPEQLIASFYPIMVFVSDPSCENILI
ncbi:unnamed protein product [Rotaria magnacalcarata]